MTIRDRVYGDISITSKVILELIDSEPLQRLIRISQFGIPDEFYYLKNFSRYEHSVGVMLLLNKLGASEEEQIAGLLHDVSHTAFSHAIDWVKGDGKTEDYQDEQHENYIKNSVIPIILEKYDYSVERIVDYHHFGLLERDLPDLCADRVDYSLREFPSNEVKKCLKELTSKNNKIVLKNEQAALTFARNFLKLQTEHWGSFEAVSRYRLFADALKLGLKDGTIKEEDFWQDDSFVVTKLQTSKNISLKNILKELRSKSLTNLPKSTTTVYKKFRYVDPLYLKNGRLLRLSENNSKFKQELKLAQKNNKLGIVIPKIN